MPQTPRDNLIDDLDAMFCAVKARLQRLGEGSVEPAAGSAMELNNRLCRSVLECVSALDQLHAMLTDEVGRRQGLELFMNEPHAVSEALSRELPADLAPVTGPPLRMPPDQRLFSRGSIPAGAK